MNFFFMYTARHFTPRVRYELNKMTSLPMSGFIVFIAQLVEHRTGIVEVKDSNSIEALIFFRLLLANGLNCKINCDDLSLLSLEGVFIGYPNTSNFVKNTPLRVVFSTLFSMFGYEILSLVFDKLYP